MMKMQRTRIALSLGLVLSAFGVTLLSASAETESITIDARTPSQEPRPTSYRGGAQVSPSGHRIGVNSMYLTMDGRPWLPVMGEFHYSRVPESEWEEELLKMKAAGVQIVSTYIIWIHHEEVEGVYEWSGQRDLRRFAELCRKHGLYLFARVGPWTHGESRNGGLPDWILKEGPTRRNDPRFMAHVAAFYAQISAQLKGMLWKDGGPVIGVQLENEYSARGPMEGEEYILALKKVAIKSGLDVPLYTITGWDNAVVPQGEVLPVFGGYPDAPWDSSIAALPPNEVYAFRFQSRVAGSMGNIGGAGHPHAIASDTPFLTAELGGGVQDTYHRRPIIAPDDVAAMVPVMLGSGANLYGYYMFQGGENPDGKLTTLQESQATGYPTDVPVKSYDFQAPLSEFGLERASFRKLKVFHYFLNDFGGSLARMSVHAPAKTPREAADLNVVRASVRSDGEHGFLFVNNYVRGSSMPVRKDTQFAVMLPESELRIPEKPVDIPADAYFIWPFNLELGDATLKYATAQLFTHIESADSNTYFFEEVPGIAAEFVIKSGPGVVVHADGAVIKRLGDDISISGLPAGLNHEIRIKSGKGKEIRLILLSSKDAENSWKAEIDGSMHLLQTDLDYFEHGQSVVLQSLGEPRSSFTLYPGTRRHLKLTGGDLDSRVQGQSTHFTAAVPEVHPVLEIKKVQEAGKVPPVKLGPSLSWRPQGVAMAPEDSDFKLAAKWAIVVKNVQLNSTVSNAFLRVDYIGDVARLSANGHLLVDDFANGKPWMVGMRRFSGKTSDAAFDLSILPWRKDAPIFLEKQIKPVFDRVDQAVDLKSATLTPQYRFQVTIEPN